MLRFIIRSVVVSFVLSVIAIFILIHHLHTIANDHFAETKTKEIAVSMVEQDLVLHFINLNIGKSTLIQMGEQGVLIDVGDQKDSKSLLSYLENCGIKTISHIFLSNSAPENSSGLEPILEKYPSISVYVPELTEQNYPIFKGITYHSVKAGEKIALSKARGIAMDILAPLPPSLDNVYNDSLVCLLQYGKLRVLLTSDIREEAEDRLLQHYPNIQAEIMTVPDRPTGVTHSKTFIQKVNPQTAVMVEMPCNNCNQVIKDSGDIYSQEWSDFFFVPIGKNLTIYFNDGAYTTPKNQVD